MCALQTRVFFSLSAPKLQQGTQALRDSTLTGNNVAGETHVPGSVAGAGAGTPVLPNEPEDLCNFCYLICFNVLLGSYQVERKTKWRKEPQKRLS